MNMSANGVNSANTQLMNNYNNTAAQKAQQAGAFFGAWHVAGYLGGFARQSKTHIHKQLGIGAKMEAKSAINPVATNSYTNV